MAALDDLRVARDDRDARRRCRPRDRLDLRAEIVGRESLLEHERERQRERPRARDGEVVHCAVDGELADRAAREPDRLDDEAVGREREVAHDGGVGELLETERGREQAFDQRERRLAAGAVGHRDLLVAEPKRFRLDPLDEPEDLLLGAVLDRHQTAAGSREKRP